MSTAKTTQPKIPAGLMRSAACTALALLFAQGPAHAAATDLAGAPLSSGAAVQVKPNIMFILDASGSMGSDFLPDSVSSDTSKVGFRNFQCNLIYFNPSITYLPPKRADGTDFPNATFTSAKDDGYGIEATTSTPLGVSFKANSSDTAQPAYYFSYSGTQTLKPSTSPCTQSIPSPYLLPFAATGGGTWTKVLVPVLQQQNFANWYSYYRKRIFMAKTAASLAFDPIDDHYRVGFITITPMNGSTVDSNKFLKIADFTSAQRTSWYAKLFAQDVGNSTPLREALARVGRYYGGKNDGINTGMIPTQADDPVQYSCQQNFSILTTDGQWNTGDETAGPVKLDGSTKVGQQDGLVSVVPRPMYDGATASQTRTDTWIEYRYSTSSCSGSSQKIQHKVWTVTANLDPVTGAVIGTPTASSGSFTSGNWYNNTCKNPPVVRPPDNRTGMPPQITPTAGTTIKRADPAYPPGGFGSPAKFEPAPATPCTTWPCIGAVVATGGSTDSLADVAQYYYNTDLRPAGSTGALGSAVSDDNVPNASTGVEDDKANWQHMTTFTMGLGLAGTLTYRADYKATTTITGDFAAIRAGTKNWPLPSASGNPPENVDDLWHAAVDGRGVFFSANNPDEVVGGLTTALQGVKARVASAAAAATSNLEPVAGDNFAFTAKYTTQKWFGDLEARNIDLATGQISSTTNWSAMTKLDTATGAACDNRTIKVFRSGATNNLADFTSNTQRCDTSGNPTGTASSSLNSSELDTLLKTSPSGPRKVTLLSQDLKDGTSGTNDQLTAANTNLVNFIRGQRGKEGFVTNDLNFLYRQRDHILGDIVNAQPVFVKGAIGSYGDTGYAAYKTAQTTRTPMVYAAANDGMLHAFFAGNNTLNPDGTVTLDPQGGIEAWAFIPTMVLPNLYKLADTNYADNHIYTTDGTPVTGDVFDPVTSTWKTILVGGLNGGGQGYYALDVTDPATPKGLWEFKLDPANCNNPAAPGAATTDCDVGFSFGNPLIAKLKLPDGRWAVFFTSGYNNASGAGALFVVNAMTGQIIYKILTGVGSSGTPSGLNKIAGWADDPLVNNTAERVYGVDILGNIWRFDVNDILGATGREAQLLATAKDAAGVGGVPQPITTKPELGLAGSPPTPFVFVATGRYLGVTDLPAPPTVPQVQSIYAIQDAMSSTTIPDLRTALRKNTITTTTISGTIIRQTSCTGNCSSAAGWFVDLPESGERTNVDPQLQLGTLIVGTNVPETNSCSVGGHSWLNFFNYSDGLAVANSADGSVGTQLSANALVVGINVVRLPGGKTVVEGTDSNAGHPTINAPFASKSLSGKRVSWRELVQ